MPGRNDMTIGTGGDDVNAKISERHQKDAQALTARNASRHFHFIVDSMSRPRESVQSMLDRNLLRGPKPKVKRATERIDALGDVHAKLFANTVPELVEERDPSNGDRLLKLKLDVAIPETFALLSARQCITSGQHWTSSR